VPTLRLVVSGKSGRVVERAHFSNRNPIARRRARGPILNRDSRSAIYAKR
jgi:hypothetical protein